MRFRSAVGGVLLGVVCVAVVTATVAEATTRVALRANPVYSFSGRFAPKFLPGVDGAPVKLHLANRIGTPDGSHPPALRELQLEIDRHVEVDVSGKPMCRRAQIEASDPEEVKKRCRVAIVGDGTMAVEIAISGSAPVSTRGRTFVLNGGVHQRVTTLLIYSYFTAPVPAAVVNSIEIRRIRDGRYGLKATLPLPVIAGGSGSTTRFDLTIDKGILFATCPSHDLRLRSTAVFADGSRLTGKAGTLCV